MPERCVTDDTLFDPSSNSQNWQYLWPRDLLTWIVRKYGTGWFKHISLSMSRTQCPRRHKELYRDNWQTCFAEPLPTRYPIDSYFLVFVARYIFFFFFRVFWSSKIQNVQRTKQKNKVNSVRQLPGNKSYDTCANTLDLFRRLCGTHVQLLLIAASLLGVNMGSNVGVNN